VSRKNREAEREMRRKKVAANLLAGMNYREMAAALGVSIGTIANDVKIILGRWQREQVETVDEWVQIEEKRIDRAINAIWNDILDGNLGAIDRLIRLQDQRAKYRDLYCDHAANTVNVAIAFNLEDWKARAKQQIEALAETQTLDALDALPQAEALAELEADKCGPPDA
jgi:hypothetical protein